MNGSGQSGVSFSPSFRISKFMLEKYTVEKRSLDYGVSGTLDFLAAQSFSLYFRLC